MASMTTPPVAVPILTCSKMNHPGRYGSQHSDLRFACAIVADPKEDRKPFGA